MERVLVVYGTRPEAVKLAPVVHALQADRRLTPVVCVTAQHRELLDQMNARFGIEPAEDLDLMRTGQTLDEVTASVVQGMAPVLERLNPAAVVVQGDTTTSFAAALAAFYAQIPVAHVEAGLRTGKRYAPFPEELNRRLTTQLASIHLAPTAASRANLRREGVRGDDIFVTGNTVIDALRWMEDRLDPVPGGELGEVLASGGPIVLVTVHRRESWGQPLQSIAAALAVLAARHPEAAIVVPLHPNPLVRSTVTAATNEHANVLLLEPLGYSDFIRVMRSATVVLTDSGGVQEEAPSFGRPVLVLRDTTERPEGIDAGIVRLIGTETTAIVEGVSELLTDVAAREGMQRVASPYGDGRAADRCVRALRHVLFGEPRPDDFSP